MTLASPPQQLLHGNCNGHDGHNDEKQRQQRHCQLERDLGVEADVSRVLDQRGPASAVVLYDDQEGLDDDQEGLDDDQEELDDDQEELDDQLDQLDRLDRLDHPASAAQPQASLYYDASTMASLNPLSVAALGRLRAYEPPPFPLWHALPVRRRAAVLVLLYADRAGDLRVVVTMRAASLRSFSGHAALPGGKADSTLETPYQIARREAFEEIGLPMDDQRIPRPFRIEPLCILPPSLARTHLVVTPCVAFLNADSALSSSSSDAAAAHDDDADAAPPLVEDSLIPRLDAREVAAVFSAPFYNFLKAADLPPPPGQALPPGHWYDGTWIAFKDLPWRVHNFYVPVNNQRVSKPRPRRRSSAASMAKGDVADALDDQQELEGRFKVWGMTGRVLVDAARIAYAEEPEMEHNQMFGDYDVIMRAEREGAFQDDAPQNKVDGNKGSPKM